MKLEPCRSEHSGVGELPTIYSWSSCKSTAWISHLAYAEQSIAAKGTMRVYRYAFTDRYKVAAADEDSDLVVPSILNAPTAVACS